MSNINNNFKHQNIPSSEHINTEINEINTNIDNYKCNEKIKKEKNDIKLKNHIKDKYIELKSKISLKLYIKYNFYYFTHCICCNNYISYKN